MNPKELVVGKSYICTFLDGTKKEYIFALDARLVGASADRWPLKFVNVEAKMSSNFDDTNVSAWFSPKPEQTKYYVNLFPTGAGRSYTSAQHASFGRNALNRIGCVEVTIEDDQVVEVKLV